MSRPVAHPRAPRSTTVAFAAAVALGFVVFAGCGAPVAVTPPPDVPSVCGDLQQALPKRVEGQERRPTTPESSATAAWGDPPMVLVCGVSTPAAYNSTSSLLDITGVSWFAEPLSAGVRFTTIGRVANVEFTVPDAYSPEAYPLIDLASAIATTVPKI